MRGALPDDGQDPFEVCLVQLLLQHDQVLVQVVDQGLGVTTCGQDFEQFTTVIFDFNS